MKRVCVLVGTAISLLLLTGCAGTPPEAPVAETFSLASRQLPPEPVYNRLRWVFPPQPLPSRDGAKSTAGQIVPLIDFDVKNATLEEAARILAASARYHYYVASDLANKKVSLKVLGNVDDIANKIEKLANIAVVVDHSNREIRLLADRPVEPEFPEQTVLNEQVSSHEYQSTN